MSEPQCGFVWYELMTTDIAAAEAFYTRVVGWGAETSPLAPPGMEYRLLTAAGFPSAGLMALPPRTREAGARPGWLGHVGVADLDAKLAQAERLGATICVPATDLPKIGRFACIQDPQGAMLGLFSPECSEPPQAPPPGTPGRIGWHELYATNWQEAFAFYSAMFGWQKADALDMGAMGTYQLFSHAGQVVGGMMDKPATLPKPAWQYYVNVAEIDGTAARIAEGGGKVLMGPHQVPGGSWIVQAEDPQGGAFAVVAPRRG
jgi:predicted enzyme related to lactoylglutathione lyase